MRLNEYQIKDTQDLLRAGIMQKPAMARAIEVNALLGINAEVGALNGCYLMDGTAPGTSDLYRQLRLGATLSYIAELCTANNWSLEEIAEMSLNCKEDRYHGKF
jgi:hypothetical protein